MNYFMFNESFEDIDYEFFNVNNTTSYRAISKRGPGHYVRLGDIIDNSWVQALFCTVYTIVFVLGMCGNILVCAVVFRNRAMQTVTNLFITNLALSDILMCVFAVPFTPLYTFLGKWSFGSLLCHIMPFAQGLSVYISTLTLTSIAIDRFFVIIYPFRPRMKMVTCMCIIIIIWCFSIVITLPYAIFMDLHGEQFNICDEAWPSENFRRVYGALTSILQFILPFVVIAFCYTCVSFKLNDRAKSKPISKNSRRQEIDKDRKRKTNQMLITMVAIFGASWFPLNAINMCNDFHVDAIRWKYYFICFFAAHLVAMSSVCYNPFIYAWLNENFRKEFKILIPCFDTARPMGNLNMQDLALMANEKPNNGTTNTNTDTFQESMFTSGVARAPSLKQKLVSSDILNSTDSKSSTSDEQYIASDVRHCHISTSYNLRRESVKLRLINEESFCSMGKFSDC